MAAVASLGADAAGLSWNKPEQPSAGRQGEEQEARSQNRYRRFFIAAFN